MAKPVEEAAALLAQEILSPFAKMLLTSPDFPHFLVQRTGAKSTSKTSKNKATWPDTVQ